LGQFIQTCPFLLKFRPVSDLSILVLRSRFRWDRATDLFYPSVSSSQGVWEPIILHINYINTANKLYLYWDTECDGVYLNYFAISPVFGSILWHDVVSYCSYEKELYELYIYCSLCAWIFILTLVEAEKLKWCRTSSQLTNSTIVSDVIYIMPRLKCNMIFNTIWIAAQVPMPCTIQV
jgi:hypothetical protein